MAKAAAKKSVASSTAAKQVEKPAEDSSWFWLLLLGVGAAIAGTGALAKLAQRTAPAGQLVQCPNCNFPIALNTTPCPNCRVELEWRKTA